MGWEDDTKDPQPSTETNNARELPASYPRTEGQYDLEMRNLGSEEISIQRSRSPVDGLRRRLSRDPQVRMEREKEEEKRMNQREVPVAVVEQRLSNLAQGCLCTSYSTSPSEANDRLGAYDFTIPTCPWSYPKRRPSWSLRMSPSYFSFLLKRKKLIESGTWEQTHFLPVG